MPDFLLPQNATPLELALSGADTRVSQLDVNIIRRVHNIDLCPEAWLPILALAWSVDEWEPQWPVDRKREVIRQSVDVHRRKGTWGAMKRAFYALGYGGTIEEWFTYDGDPYHFRVLVNLNIETLTVAQMAQITRVALNTKNVRSMFEGFTGIRDAPGDVYALAGAHQELSALFQPLEQIDPQFPGVEYVIGGVAPINHRAMFNPLP